MADFQDYNLIDIVYHLAFEISPGRETEYLSQFPEAVRKAALRNFTNIANARIPRMSAKQESELIERVDGLHPSGF